MAYPCYNKTIMLNHRNKKGYFALLFLVLSFVFCSIFAIQSFATQTCTTNQQTGQVTCTNSVTASVTVSSACSFERGENDAGEYSGTLVNNGDVSITGSTFTTLCNDAGGYAIYAVGYSNNTLGNTDLIFNNTPSSTNNIHTDGSGSNWGMTLSTAAAAAAAGKPVIESGFSDSDHPHTIPGTYTKVASYGSVATEMSGDQKVGQSVTVHYYAHASATQPAGTYTGAVKYTMVHPGNTPTPIKMIDDLEYMQDFAALTNAEKTSVLNSMGMETTYTLKDKRDEQEYTIAKLKDNKVWMTKNLNLAGDTLLSSDMTDFDSSYNLPTNQGWQSDGRLPASSVSGFDTNNYAYVYNSGNNTDTCSSPGCYSYYSWDAATLGSGRNISEANTDAPYSICPKGWRLPTSGGTSNDEWKRGDFYALAVAYGADLENSYYDNSVITGANFYNNAGPGTLPNFLLAGVYNPYFSGGGSWVSYWSSTTYQSDTKRARTLFFDSSSMYSADFNLRRCGLPVRCLVQ